LYRWDNKEVNPIKSLALCVSAGILSAQTSPAAAPKPKAPATAVKPAGTAPKATATTPPKTPGAKPAVAKTPAKTPGQTAEPDGKVVLTIGTEKITDKQFDAFVDALPDQVKAQARGPMKRQVAEQMVRVRLLADEAKKRGVDKDPSFAAKAAFQYDNLLAGAMFADMQKDVKSDDASMRKYFDAHKQELEFVQARHILIKYKGSPVPNREGQKELTEEEALAKATDVRKKILGGEDFAKLAKAESDDVGSGNVGGDLGNFKRGQMVPAFDQAAFAAKVNEVTEPIKTQFGYHIIKVEKHADFDELKPDIEKRIKPDAARELVEDVRKKATVTFDEAFFGPEAPKPETPNQPETPKP
jgi:peptidyl-prolyl cis-trans isomerase C